MVAGLPWKDLVIAIPTGVVTAKEIWRSWSSRPKPAPIDPDADPNAQLAALSKRLVVLESTARDQAKLVSQMAEQLQIIVRRVTFTYWFALGALLISCAALLFVVSH